MEVDRASGFLRPIFTHHTTEATQAYVSVFLKTTKLQIRYAVVGTLQTLWELAAIDLIAYLNMRNC